MNERRHVLLEQIQEDNEHVRSEPPWRESTSKRGGGTFKEKTTEETLGILQCLIQDNS